MTAAVKSLPNMVEPDWAALRREFPTLARWTHLDLARKAVLPRWVEAATQEWFADVYENAGQEAFSMDRFEDARAALARLLGLDPAGLAMVKNTSEGANIIARGLKLRRGDNVVIGEAEHENNTFPWRYLERDGIEVRIVPMRPDGRLPPEDYAKLIDRDTRVVSVAWVAYGNGYRADIAGLRACMAGSDAWMVVDAMHGAGVLAQPLGELGADAVICGGHKALLALAGAGFLHVRPDRIAELEPPYAAKFSFTSNDRFRPELQLAADAHRFEYGNPNFLGCWVLRRSAEKLHSMGLAAIENRVRDLTTTALQLADERGIAVRTPRAWQDRAGIISFDLRQDADAMVARLKAERVIASVKDGFVRIACHFYNDESDLHRFFEVACGSRA
ncbi:MAG: aminotransferase class V-fold PLP-dependent enzyme [Hyphomicrobiaceae bacterium]|nr:aminotransferase class V-fold PLP-dependent enzyme [Hyphomicrobiaceae bacterium]